jgi:FAD/FMN-containing dehydrogenase/SAM-dependent methyltransferase
MAVKMNNVDTLINDVTGLNPIQVSQVISPSSIDEIQNAVKNHKGSISIGGGRFSMGGQIGSEHSLHIDMRQFNQIVSFNPEDKTICVQAGITWRNIQEQIDTHDLSIKIMQTYANFTVGGSLSVNAHGRYVSQGPLILSVRSLKIVLANGELIHVSPTDNAIIFFGAIGGYGGLGIIVEVTLELAPNVKIERQQMKLDVTDYRQYFFDHIRDNTKAIFHNADLYPPYYTKARAITWVESEKPLTAPHRVVQPKHSYWLERYFIWAVTSTPLGKWRREYIIDPLIYLSQRVVWRNSEASCYDIKELEPRSRIKATYVLQEYFIPVMRFDEFIGPMIDILQRYQVNALNISVRHARKDPGALMAWAKDEVFAFVLYYKQGVSQEAINKVGIWTRELIEATLAVNGSYYLPYQLHATPQQFRRAYPRAQEFFLLKQELDPENKFHNKLWDKYYPLNEKPQPLIDTLSLFKRVYSDEMWRDKFYLFLQNIYNIYPEDSFHLLIQNMTERYTNDRDIFEHIQQKLPSIKPKFADLRYAVPALIKQKKEIARQTLMILDTNKTVSGYVEIGSTGRYISELKKHLRIKNPIYIINDLEPGYSPVDIAERGQLPKLGQFIAMNNYDEISTQSIPDESVDVVTCYIGLHHVPLTKLDKFVQSIHRILRPGGIFIVRDHDVTTPEMRVFVSLVHAVFNAGLGVSWEENSKELRNFTALDDLITYLGMRGFKSAGKKIVQDHDPSLNTLLEFVKGD